MSKLPAEQFQAPRGTCRYCGCTDERPCSPRCYWADPRRTLCSAPECSAKYRALQFGTLQRMICPVCLCGRAKSTKKMLCLACWDRLPWTMSAELFEPISRGLSVYYAEAVAYLNAIDSESRKGGGQA